MSHGELLAALDQRLDALVSGADVVLDLTDDASDALELQQMLTAARIVLRALEEPLSPATRERHLQLLRRAAAGERKPRRSWPWRRR